MGQEDVNGFKTNPENLFENIGNYDMVSVCAQECRKKYKHERLKELEQFMQINDFWSVEFTSMWQMWLAVFVKRKFKD